MSRIARFAVLAVGFAAASCGGGGTPSATPAAGTPTAAEAPEFELKDVTGKIVRLSDTKGTVRLIDFWTTWCAPCREEIPMFKDLQATYGPKGFAIVGIAMDEEGLAAVKPFVEQNSISYLTLVGDEAVKASYGPLVGFPTKVLVDRNGRIVQRYIGPVPRAVLEKEIQALL